MGHDIATAFIGYKAAQAMLNEQMYGTEKKAVKKSLLARILRRKATDA